MEKEWEDKRLSAKNRKRRYYEPIIKRSKYWPVVQLTKHRKEFVESVTESTLDRLLSLYPKQKDIIETIETAHYREKQRIKHNPWRVDPPDELEFWNTIKDELVRESNKSDEEGDEVEILRKIVSRYTNEIAGNFKPSRYSLTRSIVKFWLRRLLNASRVKGMFAFFKSDYNLTDVIQIYGKIKQLRHLAKDATIVMVPTHFSNLDSILIGWIIHVLGLPPFIYGAGLNLFNIKLFAYFMNSLGAYKVDRRKKNPIYLETLKMYSHKALMKGAHSLFFPGGTRSRSGHIEKTLKRGLLGTAIEAQRSLLMNPETAKRKIYIVPVTINYHFVLEAPGLINDYLKKTGQERYYKEKDEFSTSYKISKFLMSFFTKRSNISVSIGRPMDVLGNYVDDDGISLDRKGHQIDIKDYFLSKGEITTDDQRESEYTRVLSERIVEEYHKSNRVFASHLVAWVAFRHWQSRYPKLDLFSFLRVPEDELEIDMDIFRDEMESARKKILELKNNKKLNVARHLLFDIDKVIEMGLENVGLYHIKRPLLIKNNKIVTDSLATLYYYHNRMDGYDL